MVEDRLNYSLMNMGYQRLDSNTPGVYLYYRTEGQDLYIVSVVPAINGDEITQIQYQNLLDQVKDYFRKSYPYNIQLLSLVFTRYPYRAKYIFATAVQDSHWIIDLSTNRLMIYESQAYDFGGLKKVIEQLLEEDVPQALPDKPSTLSPFTWMNMLLIIINIIAYIIVHFTNMFGGAQEAFYKGANSWYYVIEDKQYYRLLTSMFMHADPSHLLNNMFVMLFIGASLERAAGKLRYIFIYFGTGILAGLTSIGYNMWKENGAFVWGDSVMAIGASGAIFGLVGALFYIVLINRGRLKEISTRQIVIFVALSLYSGVANAQIDQAAHVGGFLSGVILALLIYRRKKDVIS